MRDLQMQKQQIGSSLEEYTSKQEQLQKTIVQLEADYEDLEYELRQHGKESAGAQVIAKEMNELQIQLKACQSKQSVLEVAVVKMQSILRRVERYELLEDSGFTSDELDEINQAILEINCSIELEYTSESEDLDVEEIFDTLDD